MANIAKDMRDYLVSEGIIEAANSGNDWSGFVAEEPNSEKATVTFYNTGGRTPNVKWLIDYPSVQVRVRGLKNGYENSRAKIQEIKDKLIGLPSQMVGSTWWVSVAGMGDIIDMPFENSRPIHVMNFRLIVEPPAGAGVTRQAL